ncbi:DsbA family oxidoreductase [Rhodobacteraceae bacterium M382]|nr:DsbA family oxidoreductase [Rhodobacteraceae bacterium M382]
MTTTTAATVQVDIISDVVCPWCIVGFRQLSQALEREGIRAAVRWHPFELNPDMGIDGQNLREHLMQKYGISAEDSIAARQRLTDLGADLGIAFNFTDEMRMVNTFRAHQLLDWAEDSDKQTDLKQALFAAYFTKGLDVSDSDVLVGMAESVGLDPDEARRLLNSGERAQQVRQKQQFWTSRGITGVPAMVFAGKYLVTGAQGTDAYADVLTRCQAEAA